MTGYCGFCDKTIEVKNVRTGFKRWLSLCPNCGGTVLRHTAKCSGDDRVAGAMHISKRHNY